MRGSIAILVTLYLLRALSSELNNALSAYHLWFFGGGLFVAYSALMMPFRQGFAASFVGGLLCDAASPLAFGTHAILFAAAHTFVFNVRERLQKDDTTVRVAVALLINLFLFAAISSTRVRIGHGGEAWPRMLSDLAWSEAVIAVAAPWFFALQLHTLELARANPPRSA